MSRPLRSTPITEASPLLRTGPPARPQRYSTPHGFCRLTRSLSPTRSSLTGQAVSTSRLPTFHAGAADQDHAAFMPDTAWPVNGHPPDLSRKFLSPPVLMPSVRFDTSSAVHSRSSSWSPPDASTDAFSSSLTTTVINQRSMRWFDISPRRATSKGHTFITCTAPHQETPLRPPPSAFVAHTRSKKRPKRSAETGTEPSTYYSPKVTIMTDGNHDAALGVHPPDSERRRRTGSHIGWLCRCPVVVVVGEGTRRPAAPGARAARADHRDAGAAADPGGRRPRRLPRIRRRQHRRLGPVPAADPHPPSQTTPRTRPDGGHRPDRHRRRASRRADQRRTRPGHRRVRRRAPRRSPGGGRRRRRRAPARRRRRPRPPGAAPAGPADRGGQRPRPRRRTAPPATRTHRPAGGGVPGTTL